MNLLPKTETEFARTDYWNKFFRERGPKEFEWDVGESIFETGKRYGEFTDLCVPLCKYLKNQDSILVVGCGNSTLSSDLYDLGYRKITNIDISSVVIKQMKSKMGNERPEMIFEQMDVLNMSYEKEAFTVVLDKGTLDALMPTDSELDRERVNKLFSEVDRVLKLNGRYIIVSLLQEHILKALLNYFSEKGWMIRVLRCWDVEKKHISDTGCLTMPVFMIVCIKFRNVKSVQPILEANLFVTEKSQRIESKRELMEMVKGIQQTVFNFRESKGEIEIKFCRNGEEDQRYTIYVVDKSPDHRNLSTYGAFIVPHGREVEWMFGTEEGRKCLRNSSGFDRLAVITFRRRQKYGSMEDVQNELSQSILQLAPAFAASGSAKIPYLTLGEGLGVRETVYTGTSHHSGDILIEDVEIDGEIYRRLVFARNQSMIQTEVKMKKGTGTKMEVDACHVASRHVLYMSIPAELKFSENPSSSVAVVGVGGGSLCLLLRNLFPTLTVTGVELDPLVIELGAKYFGLNAGNGLRMVAKDGVEFLMEKEKFDVIVFDVDGKEPGSALSCPPAQFVESSVLESVAESLGKTGIFVANVVSRLESEHEKLIGKIEKHFSLIAWYNLKEDVNRIVFASNRGEKSRTKWKEKIEASATNLAKMLEEKLNLKGNDSLDLDHLMNRLTV